MGNKTPLTYFLALIWTIGFIFIIISINDCGSEITLEAFPHFFQDASETVNLKRLIEETVQIHSENLIEKFEHAYHKAVQRHYDPEVSKNIISWIEEGIDLMLMDKESIRQLIIEEVTQISAVLIGLGS